MIEQGVMEIPWKKRMKEQCEGERERTRDVDESLN